MKFNFKFNNDFIRIFLGILGIMSLFIGISIVISTKDPNWAKADYYLIIGCFDCWLALR